MNPGASMHLEVNPTVEKEKISKIKAKENKV